MINYVKLPKTSACLLIVFSCLAWSCTAFGYDGPWPKFFDFTVSPYHYGSSISPGIDQYGFFPASDSLRSLITPVPRSGSYFEWNDYRITGLYDRVLAQQRPLAIYLTPYTYPLGNNPEYENKDPQALSKTMDYLSGLPAQSGVPDSQGRLDYVFLDFEPSWQSIANANTAEVVSQVRTHVNPRINLAKIGQYNYHPCSTLPWMPYPSQNTTARQQMVNGSYFSTGVNVAQPSLYPYEYYEVHTWSSEWGTNVCPNKRAALFWAPLAKLSEAKKQLPAGHELIPYVNNMIQSTDDDYHADPPTREDNAASLQHYRLRGADGYYVLRTFDLEMENGDPCDYSYLVSQNDEYRGDMLEAWTSLDWLYKGDPTPQILNLETNKTGGLEWSGAITDQGVAVLVSNLGNDPVWFVIPDGAEYNDRLIDGFEIAPGTHRTEMFRENIDIILGLVDNGCPEAGLHSYTLTATGNAIMTLSQFTVNGKVHQVFDSGTPSEWLGDNSASETEESDSYVIFGNMRFPDLGGSTWDWDAYPEGPPDKVTEETIDVGGDSGMGTLNNFDEELGIYDVYVKTGDPGGHDTIELMQLVVADGDGFTIDLKLLNVPEHDPVTGKMVLYTHYLSYTLPSVDDPGDANGDGYVDAEDAAILAQHWLQSGGWGDGDFNGDGVVNDIDATILATNWNPPTASVPEPSMVVLLAGMCVLFQRIWHKSGVQLSNSLLTDKWQRRLPKL